MTAGITRLYYYEIFSGCVTVTVPAPSRQEDAAQVMMLIPVLMESFPWRDGKAGSAQGRRQQLPRHRFVWNKSLFRIMERSY